MKINDKKLCSLWRWQRSHNMSIREKNKCKQYWSLEENKTRGNVINPPWFFFFFQMRKNWFRNHE